MIKNLIPIYPGIYALIWFVNRKNLSSAQGLNKKKKNSSDGVEYITHFFLMRRIDIIDKTTPQQKQNVITQRSTIRTKQENGNV